MILVVTILTLKSLRVVIYTNDHRPPHVHVVGPDEHARFELLCELGRVHLMDAHGFSGKRLQEIARYLVAHLTTLCTQWGEIHGH